MGSLHETNPSLWVATTSDRQNHLPYAPVAGEVPQVDVAVVGAGITGLSTALVLAERGARVAVLEAGRICSGVTGYTTAKVTALHGLVYAGLLDNRGRDAAHAYAQANQHAIEHIANWVQRHAIDCGFERRVAVTYTTDPDRTGDIESEVDALTALGLTAEFTSDLDLPFPIAGAVQLPMQAQFHPRDYCLGLARVLTEIGAIVHEDTRVLDVDADGDVSVVQTEHGQLRADHVVLATHLPFLDRGGFFAKTHAARSYAMAVRLDAGAAMPQHMYLSADEPTRSLRSAMDESVLIVGGEGHKTGQDADTRERYHVLEAWARQTFPVASVEHRWSAQDYMPVDGTPYVGRLLPGSDTFVATGFKKWGMTNGTAAALMIADAIDGVDNPWFAAFDSTRLKSTITSKAFVTENVDAVGGHLAGDRLRTLNPPAAETLQPGEGGIVELDGDKVAGYRRDDGTLVAVSPVCRHVGCLLAWNTAEKTWDCPCHGSRYTCDGKVIEGPALHDLEPMGENGVNPPS